MINILENTSTSVSPLVESRDSGWEISGSRAVHSPCNPGTMRTVDTAGLQVGKTYVVTYDVDTRVSGGVRVILGTNEGTLRTAVGTYTENLICQDIALLSFFSNGELSIDSWSAYELIGDTSNAVTVAFYDVEGKAKKWTEYSFAAEMMIKFGNKFFSFKGGQIWQHNTNDVRNTFYGVTYPSKIKFYFNNNPTTMKMLYTMRVKSNKAWYCPNDGDITILPSDKFPDGMRSRLAKERFTPLYGDWFADFLRNLLDPRFTTPKEALFKGQELIGSVVEINIENNDTVEVVLFEVDIESAPMNYTY